MRTIIQEPHPILRQKAALVPVGEITSPRVQNLIKEMSRVLAAAEDGLALAAPQIGVAECVFIISGKLFSPRDMPGPDLVFINPRLSKLSRRKLNLEEGCLSVRYQYGQVRRAERATIAAYDERGKKFTRHGSGLVAQIFQHEMDHLDGILFIDRATNIHEIKPAEK